MELIGNFYKVETKPVVIHHYHVDIVFDKSLEKGVKDMKVKEGETVKDEAGATEGTERFFKRHSQAIFDEYLIQNKSAFEKLSPCFDGLHILITCAKLNMTGLKGKVETEIEGRKKFFIVSQL